MGHDAICTFTPWVATVSTLLRAALPGSIMMPGAARPGLGHDLNPRLALLAFGVSYQFLRFVLFGGQARIHHLSRRELYLYPDASRTPAIRNFIGSSDLGLATSCQSLLPPARPRHSASLVPAHSSRNEHYLISRQRAVRVGLPLPLDVFI